MMYISYFKTDLELLLNGMHVMDLIALTVVCFRNQETSLLLFGLGFMIVPSIRLAYQTYKLGSWMLSLSSLVGATDLML